MEKAKMQVEINNHPYENDNVYCAISFRGGNITRNYILSDNSVFAGNCAFYNVFFNYLRLSNIVGLHYDVQRAVSTISFECHYNKLSDKLNEVINIVLDRNYKEDAFENAKKITKESFTKQYKNEKFRAKFKSFEFSDLNKKFNLRTLIDDIEKIDFNSFVSIGKNLLNIGNICVYVNGKTEFLDTDSIASIGNNHTDSSMFMIAGFNFDPYLRQDAFVSNIARNDCNYVIEAFSFINPNTTNFTKLLILEILAEQISSSDCEVWVDSIDSSIVFQCEMLKKYKDLFCKIDKATFEQARDSLLSKYTILLEKRPEHFSIKAAYMMSVGIYIDQYISFLDVCNYDVFSEICKKSDYMIAEGQVSLSRRTK